MSTIQCGMTMIPRKKVVSREAFSWYSSRVCIGYAMWRTLPRPPDASGRRSALGDLEQRRGERLLALGAEDVAVAGLGPLQVGPRLLQPHTRLARVDLVAAHRLADQHHRLVLAHLD